jgi:hypothetical protein
MENQIVGTNGIATSAGYTTDYAGSFAAWNACELRREVAKAESDVRETILNQTIANDKQFCELSKSVVENRHFITQDLLNAKHELALQAQRAEYESKLATQAAIKEINTSIAHSLERVTDKVAHALEETREDIDALEDQLEECCCEAKVRGVEQTGLLNLILNALNVSKA